MSDRPDPQAEPIDVHHVLAVMLEQLAEIAWQKLGLRPDPFTQRIHRDLAQAKVAVDIVAAVAAQLEPSLDDEDRRHIQNLVRDLKVNYVQKVSESPA